MNRTPAEIDDLLSSAVVPIKVYLTDRAVIEKKPSRVGTGYLVHPYYVATCYHTVRGGGTTTSTDDPGLPFVADPDHPVLIEIAPGAMHIEATLVENYVFDRAKLTKSLDNLKLPDTAERQALIDAYAKPKTIVRANSLRDCALLRLNAPLSGRRCLPFGAGCTIGEQVWIRGFPQPESWNQEERARFLPLQFPGYIVSSCTPDFQGRVSFSIYADSLAAHAYPKGLSGAPVVTVDGLCVGHVKNFVTVSPPDRMSDLNPLVHAGQLYVAPSIYMHQLMPNVRLTHRRTDGIFLPVRYVAAKVGQPQLRLAIQCAETTNSMAVASQLREVLGAYVRSREPELRPIPLDEAASTNADVYLFLLDRDALDSSGLQSQLRNTLGLVRNQHHLIAFAYLSDVPKHRESEFIREGLFQNAIDLTDESGPFPSETVDTANMAQQQYWLRMISRLYRHFDLR